MTQFRSLYMNTFELVEETPKETERGKLYHSHRLHITAMVFIHCDPLNSLIFSVNPTRSASQEELGVPLPVRFVSGWHIVATSVQHHSLNNLGYTVEVPHPSRLYSENCFCRIHQQIAPTSLSNITALDCLQVSYCVGVCANLCVCVWGKRAPQCVSQGHFSV